MARGRRIAYTASRLNGHEWAKRQLQRRRLGVTALDNGFLSCTKPAVLQTICDQLAAADIEAFFTRWQGRLPLPLSAAHRAAGFAYQLSVLQLEVSLTQVFHPRVSSRTAGRYVAMDLCAQRLALTMGHAVLFLVRRALTAGPPLGMPIAFPVVEETTLTPREVRVFQEEIRSLAGERNAVILAHNYQRPEVQDVADYVGDSLGLSRQAAVTDARVIAFCGVHFMAETAKILSPEKTVLLPDLRAGCSLAASITADDVRRWRAEFPEYVAVGYVNTTAEVKAELDYCCTSGNAVEVIDAIPEEKGILFLPDFFLGAHLKRIRPWRRIEVWMGECHVHAAINAPNLNARRAEWPDAEVLIHPECGCAGQVIYCMGLGDVASEGVHIASTEGMVRRVRQSPAPRFIVATETGILHRLAREGPGKEFVAADPEAVCAFMKTVTLERLRDGLALSRYEITVPESVAKRARAAIDRMVSIG